MNAKPLKELKQNNNIIVKKADKGTTTVIMNKHDKIRKGQILLDEKENCKPLSSPMALETSQKAKEIINALHHGDHIDDMTKKWLSLTPNPPRIPVFYTLTKIHKPNPVGRRINDQAAKAPLNESHHLLITYFSLLLKHKNRTSKIRQIS